MLDDFKDFILNDNDDSDLKNINSGIEKSKAGRKIGYRKPTERKDQKVSISLTKSQREELKKYCLEHGTNTTSLLMKLLIDNKIVSYKD